MPAECTGVGESELDALGEDVKQEVLKEKDSGKDTGPFSEKKVWDAMRGCYDPEIPVNIVDLGLIYDLKIEDGDSGKQVAVKMTLTAQGCGMGPVIADDAKQRILALSEVHLPRSILSGIPPGTPDDFRRGKKGSWVGVISPLVNFK